MKGKTKENIQKLSNKGTTIPTEVKNDVVAFAGFELKKSLIFSVVAIGTLIAITYLISR